MAAPQCEARSEPDRPSWYPAMREAVFDPAGRIWVEGRVDGGFAFEVSDLDGRLRASLLAPERDEDVRPFARGDRLYVVAADSLGVQRLAAYRIARRSAD